MATGAANVKLHAASVKDHVSKAVASSFTWRSGLEEFDN